ncbi:hypothetical protein [Paenibacillus segetis]|uniref:Uncharacterized protein n=1 Tax=Paenibacillus segetis TaxID=1325360 RepID=A0ABQ1Y3I1_9BACL|nr:hypothetical protein [Paenibacillus segetis]GGH11289.1 hypothetical protein GCM10008013_03010 [Paenibacillus segetis]
MDILEGTVLVTVEYCKWGMGTKTYYFKSDEVLKPALRLIEGNNI